MGYTLPPPGSAREQINTLSTKKENIEAELEVQIAILKSNNSTMNSPLIDPDGFPRADVDIYAVRGARVRVIELRNDLKEVVDAIGKALERVYDPALAAPTSAEGSASGVGAPQPFAKVNGVAPGSPAAEAGLHREDLIVKFGTVTHESVGSSLQAVAEIVGANENKSITLKILREDKVVFLSLVPRNGWGGRGMLGCHIVPYTIS